MQARAAPVVGGERLWRKGLEEDGRLRRRQESGSGAVWTEGEVDGVDEEGSEDEVQRRGNTLTNVESMDNQSKRGP